MCTILFKSRLFWKQLGTFLARSKTTPPPYGKKALGETIKRLNKENKSLFGHLLNRPDIKSRRKPQSLHKADITSTAPLDGIQHEANWHKAKSRPKVALEDAGLGLHEKPIVNIPKEHVGHQSENITTATGKEGVISHVGPVPTPNPHKTPHLKLPHIIIRNMTSFPLWNNEKKDDKWSPQAESVLNLPRDNEKYLSYPSVTRILNATMSDASRAALDKWKKNLVAELGDEGFEEFHRAQLLQGTQFHSTIESFLSGTLEPDLDVSPDVEGCWQSLATVIPDVGNVHVLESHVVHHKLMYRGVIDCVAEYKGKPMLIEWKKSEKPKPELWNTYDAPLQLMAYLGAMGYDHNYQFQIRNGLVVVAYTDGAPAQVFPLDQAACDRHWSVWLKRLQQYWLQQDILQQDSLRQESLRQDSLRQEMLLQEKLQQNNNKKESQQG